MTELPPITVIKVGGSLFDLSDLAVRLRGLLDRLSDRRICLVAGGGASADIVRELQRVHELSDAAAHGIALESMRVGEQLLREIVPSAMLAGSRSEIVDAWRHSAPAVVQASTFIVNESRSAVLPLAEDWSVTSDSIAAWIGTAMGASDLLLVKSTSSPDTLDLAESAHVDEAFRVHSRSLKLQWCNLRAGGDIVPLQ